VNGPAGLFYAGGVNCTFTRIHVRNQEITDAIYNRWVASGEASSGSRVGLAFGSGPGPLNIAEFAFAGEHSDLSCEDLRAPDAAPWNSTAPYRATAFYVHDTQRSNFTNLTAENTGVSTWPVAGASLVDSDGNLANLFVRGYSYGLSTGNVGAGWMIQSYRFDAVRDNASNATIPIYLDHTSVGFAGPTFDQVSVSNAFSVIRFGGAFAFDGNFRIHDLTTDQGQWEYAILANNATGVNFTSGDIVEIDSGNVNADLRVITPVAAGDYEYRLAAVCTGQTEDPGTGFMLIAPLPQSRATVTATATNVAYGDRMIYAATRRVAAAATPSVCLGISRTRKVTGAEGKITIGTTPGN
jgi:hypothetical protein